MQPTSPLGPFIRYQKSCLQAEDSTTQEGACKDMASSAVNSLCTRIRTCKELLKSVKRVDEEPNEVSVTDMIELGEELHAALMHTRSRKTQLMMDRISTFHEQERKLIENKEKLKQKYLASFTKHP
ncbi:hypothetical protein L1887_33327 [Cichorium endivia]|nr:hypothetical protein L1887_33327 [Cichorium endivia]